MELDDRKNETASKNSEQIKRIKNGEKLLNRLHSIRDKYQLEDVIAEIEVGVHHVNKGHEIEYEPEYLSEPPEFGVNFGKSKFFIEVKSIREHENFARHERISSDLDNRLEKIKQPFHIGVYLDYDKTDGSQNKAIVRFISDKLNTQLEMNHDYEIIIDDEAVGEFVVFSKLSPGNPCRVSNGSVISYGDMTENIITQIKNANKKTIPIGSPLIVVVKVPTHVNDYELKGGVLGRMALEIFRRTDTKKVVAMREIRKDKTVGRSDRYRKISAIIYYQQEFNREKAYFFLNENSECPVNQEFIKNVYFDCKQILRD